MCQKCVPQPRPIQNEDLTEYKPSPEEHRASTEEASAEYKGYEEDPPSYPARTILALLRARPALPGTWDNSRDTTEAGVRHHNNVFDNTHFEYDLFK